MRSTQLVMATLMAVAAAGPSATPAFAADQQPLKIRARSLDQSPFGPGRTAFLEIGIERWATDDERTRLRAALAQHGNDGLLAELAKLKPRAGYIRNPGGIGWTVRFAWQQPTPDGGRRIVVATERPMPHGERLNPTALTRYRFSLAEIQLDPNGKGEGRLFPAARVSWNQPDGGPEVSEYYTMPVRLTEIAVDGLP